MSHLTPHRTVSCHLCKAKHLDGETCPRCLYDPVPSSSIDHEHPTDPTELTKPVNKEDLSVQGEKSLPVISRWTDLG